MSDVCTGLMGRGETTTLRLAVAYARHRRASTTPFLCHSLRLWADSRWTEAVSTGAAQHPTFSAHTPA